MDAAIVTQSGWEAKMFRGRRFSSSPLRHKLGAYQVSEMRPGIHAPAPKRVLRRTLLGEDNTTRGKSKRNDQEVVIPNTLNRGLLFEPCRSSTKISILAPWVAL
jgi:hypothetical protein